MINKKITTILTIIAFLIVPVLIFIRFNFLGNVDFLRYGHNQVTIHSLLLLLFGLFCIFIISLMSIRVYHLWRNNDESYEKGIWVTFGLVGLFYLIISIILVLSPTASSFPTQSLTQILSSLFFASVLISPSLLFPVGIISIILGFLGLKYKDIKPKFYLHVIFAFGIFFIISGLIPLLFLIGFWLDGGMGTIS